MDGPTADRLLERIQGPFDRLAPPDQIALVVLGSSPVTPEQDARLEALCRAEMESNHGWGPIDGVVGRYRQRHQHEQLRVLRGPGSLEEKTRAARENLRTVVYRVVGSSLEFQTRPVTEALHRALSESERAEVGQAQLEEFRRSGCEVALWLAHSLGTPVEEAIEPHLAARGDGPLAVLAGQARRERAARLLSELPRAPLEAARGLVERLLPLHPAEEVYEVWSEALPAEHWAAGYSTNPRERYEACYSPDPELFRELARRLGDHGAVMTACEQAVRLMGEGVPRSEAFDRALLGYLVPGQPGVPARVTVSSEAVQVGAVRLRRR